jgi:hypothetical protein
MALSGDIVVNFAANFASFSDGMKKATDALSKFGEDAAKLNGKLETAFSFVKGLGIAGAIASAVNEVKKLADATEAAALDAGKAAQQYKLTTDQVQALQQVSAQTGRSMDDLAKTGKANVEWMAKVTEEAKRAGTTIDAEFITRLKELQAESDNANRRLLVLLAPAVSGVKSWAADAIQRIKDDLEVIAKREGIIDKVMALLRMLSYGGDNDASRRFNRDELERDVAAAEKAAAEARQRATPVGNYGVPDIIKQRAAEAEKKVQDLRLELARLNEEDKKRQQYGPGTTGLSPPPPAPPDKPTGGGGGGGRTDADSLQAQIDRYRALAEATRKSSEAIEKQREERGLLYDDLQREARVQRTIEEIAAKLGAKYQVAGKEGEALRAQLREEITLYERRKEAQEKWLESVKQAEEINNRLGSGNVARRRLDEEVERLRRGGAEPEALNRYIRERNELLRAGSLAAKRYDDDLGSLSAGFQSASDSFARSNDMFNLGQQAFTGVVGAMGEALDVLGGKSSKTFEQVAADFANMLAKMALQMAISQAFKILLSFISPSKAPQVGNSFGDVMAGGMFEQRAIGGPVLPNVPYVVGERGPELFVPTAAGNIQPAGSFGGGTSNVTVNVDMKRAEGASDPASALEFGRRVKTAVQSVIENEKRPGGSLYSRA